jgi:hypothetical protein
MKKAIDGCGTSFHGSYINSSVNKLIKVLGKPDIDDNGCNDKVNFDWWMEYNGTIFTVYDWKEYRKLDLDEEICFHIGGYSKEDTEKVRIELERLLC